jgi:hypothetical protein
VTLPGQGHPASVPMTKSLPLFLLAHRQDHSDPAITNMTSSVIQS